MGLLEGSEEIQSDGAKCERPRLWVSQEPTEGCSGKACQDSAKDLTAWEA